MGYKKSVTMKKGLQELGGTGAIGLIAAKAIVIPALRQTEWYDPAWDEAIVGMVVALTAACLRMWRNWRKREEIQAEEE